MFLKQVTVRRQGYYGYGSGSCDPKKPFEAVIEVTGASGEVKLNLSPELSKRIVDIIAVEVAAAGRATAEMMTAEAFEVAALPAS